MVAICLEQRCASGGGIWAASFYSKHLKSVSLMSLFVSVAICP